MEQLQQALSHYIQQKLSFKELTAILDQQLAAEPDSVGQIQVQLRTLQEQRQLPMPVYAELDLYVQQFHKRQQTPEATPVADRFKWRLVEEWPDEWQKQPVPELKANYLVKNSYRLKYKIAEDITGEYWQAIDTLEDERSAKRVVMLRFLDPSLNNQQTLLNNLRHDFHNYQQVRHPNFLSVHEMGRDGGLVFISFAWFQANTLRNLLELNPTGIPLHGAQDIIESLAAILDYSHKHISHLYLTPENIFYDPMRKITQVADCGLTPLLLASANQSSNTARDHRLAYTDCALLGGMKNASPQSYVYTLACLSYELLSGQHPFNAANCLEAGEKQFQANTLVNLSTSQWQVLSQALSFDSDQRPRSVNKLCSSLYPPKTWTNKLIAILGVGLLLGAGLLYLNNTLWHYQSIRAGVIAQQADDVRALESQNPDIQLKILQDEGSAIKDALARFYIQDSGNESIDKIARLAPPVRNVLLYDPAAKKRLLAYYDAEIKTAIKDDKFELAGNLAQNLQRHYQETSEWQTQISLQYDQRVAEIEGKYKTCFEAEITLANKTPCLQENRAILSQIDPQHPLLDAAPLQQLYQKICEQFMKKGAYAQAKSSLDNWQSLLPEADVERERLSRLVAQHLDIQQHIEQKDFTSATRLLKEAQTLYPQRKDFKAYQKSLEKLRKAELKNLSQRYQIIFDQELLIPSAEEEDIFDIRAELKRIDPEHKLLRNDKLHDLFFEKVIDSAKNADNALEEVKALLEAWQHLFEEKAYISPLNKERLEHARNRVTLYYLQRAKQEQKAAYAQFALGLKPVTSVEEKLKTLLESLQTAPTTSDTTQ